MVATIVAMFPDIRLVAQKSSKSTNVQSTVISRVSMSARRRVSAGRWTLKRAAARGWSVPTAMLRVPLSGMAGPWRRYARGHAPGARIKIGDDAGCRARS
jgi:hypothetical protein